MKLAGLVGLVILVAACGAPEEDAVDPVAGGSASSASSSASTATRCVARTGIYRAVYSYRSGTCGAGFERNENANAVPDCVDRGSSSSADNCAVTVDILCQGTKGPYTQVGKVNWGTSGATGSGSMSYDFRDTYGAQICQGIYDVAFTRL